MIRTTRLAVHPTLFFFQNLLGKLVLVFGNGPSVSDYRNPETTIANEPLLPPKTNCVSRPCDAGI